MRWTMLDLQTRPASRGQISPQRSHKTLADILYAISHWFQSYHLQIKKNITSIVLCERHTGKSVYIYIRMSIVTQQCVVTISPVPYVFFVGIFLRKWKLYIFGKLRVLWIWKPMLAFFSIPPWPQSWIFKMAAVFS